MTLDDLSAQFNDVRVIVARMDGKLDVLVQGQADHEKRLRWLEQRVPSDLLAQLATAARSRWVMLGAAAASGAAGSKISQLLGL